MALARVERELGVSSTYFVLLTSDFYNPASKGSVEKLRSIQSMGHEVGLHFDEKAYLEGTPEETVSRILHERDILASILETPVTTVSMHRPSQATLESDLQIPGMINSYGQTFSMISNTSRTAAGDGGNQWRKSSVPEHMTACTF